MSNDSSAKSLSLSDLANIKIDWRRDARSSISMKFTSIRGYADTVEKVLPEYKKEIDKRFLALGKNTVIENEDERDDLYREHDIELFELEHDFPQVLRYSLFVYSYSRFEKTLLGIADDYQRSRGLKLKPSELKDAGIKRAMTYLKNVVIIPFPDMEPSWKDILTLSLIRNHIAHNEGELPAGRDVGKEIREFIKKWNDNISIEDGRFEFSQGFIIRVLDTFDTFFDKLFEILPEK